MSRRSAVTKSIPGSSRVHRLLNSPPDRYRPVPWLAWTGALDWPTLESQLTDMRRQGITEFFLFPIYGMELAYLGQAYWERVEQTLEFCRTHGMKCWIYDDYNWPSGTCAGTVLRDCLEAHCRNLCICSAAAAEAAQPPPEAEPTRTAGPVVWTTAPYQGFHVFARGVGWGNRMHGYLDVLSVEANRRFLASTHERYYSRFGQDFGAAIPGFFTDEPGLVGQSRGAWRRLPFTADLFESFQARFGYDLRARLADLVLDGPDAARTRCHYWRWVAERFGEAWGAQQRAWCDAHGVALTGHCLGEEEVSWHIAYSGDLWEILRHFTIPGIDLLCNADGFTYPYRVGFGSAYGKTRPSFHLTCKLVHGVVRHSGGRQMMCEAFGVCDWGMNLARQKCGLHYQAAMGVTLVNDNSLITSIADFRKYAIAGKHFTQPWWECYRQYADYNARVTALHAETAPRADIALLYPRSTLWSRHTGTLAAAPALEPLQALLTGLLDEWIRRQWPADFVFEPVLEKARVEGDTLVTEHATYRALVVPSATELPEGVLRVLDAFAAAGGVLVFCGELPAREVDSRQELAPRVEAILKGPRTAHVPAAAAAVCEAITRHVPPPLDLRGRGCREIVSSWRQSGRTEVFFLANMAEQAADLAIRVSRKGMVTVLDPDGMAAYRPALTGEGAFGWHFEPWQAAVITVTRGARHRHPLAPRPEWLDAQRVAVLAGPWDFELEPGNMIALAVQVRPDSDGTGVEAGWLRGEDGEGWLTPQAGLLPEPLTPAKAPWHWVRAEVICEPGAQPAVVVGDSPDVLEVYVNGQAAEPRPGIALWTAENVAFDVSGRFRPGLNRVVARVRTSPYSDPRLTAFEAAPRWVQPLVLLGRFAVELPGTLKPWSGQMDVDRPWEAQGVPHAAGVGTYRRVLTLPAAPGRKFLRLPQCSDAVDVLLNGRSCGVRVWHPYVFDLTSAALPGANELAIRVRNTLGHIIPATYGGQRPSAPPTSGLQAAPEVLCLQTPATARPAHMLR